MPTIAGKQCRWASEAIDDGMKYGFDGDFMVARDCELEVLFGSERCLIKDGRAYMGGLEWCAIDRIEI